MQNLVRKLHGGGRPDVQKRAAVGSSPDTKIKELAVATAKSVVGIDSRTRRIDGNLSMVCLVPEHYP